MEKQMKKLALAALVSCLGASLVVACGKDDDKDENKPADNTTTTIKWADVSSTVQSCRACHGSNYATSGGGYDLSTADKLKANASAAADAVEKGRMPKGSPSIAASTEGQNLIKWLKAGATDAE